MEGSPKSRQPRHGIEGDHHPIFPGENLRRLPRTDLCVDASHIYSRQYCHLFEQEQVMSDLGLHHVEGWSFCGQCEC